MYAQFARDVNTKTDTANRWLSMTRCDLKMNTKSLICAAQEHVLRINNVKCRTPPTATNGVRVVREVKRYETSFVNARNWHNANSKGAMTMWQEGSIGSSVAIKGYKEQKRGMRKSQKESPRT